MNATSSGAVPCVGVSVNDAVGAGTGAACTVTTSVRVTVSDPDAFVARNDTV